MEDLPRFPLFRDPVKEKSFKRSKAKCECCGQRRGWIYDCNMYGRTEPNPTLCPWCIADGSAAAKYDCTFNDASIYPVFDHTPRLSAEDVELVECRTPGFVTWQYNGWKMCCGRACEYIGEAFAADLTGDGKWVGAVPSILGDEGWSEEEARELIESMGTDPAAYVFQCRVCGGLLGFWDCS